MSFDYPDDLRYRETHEWLRPDGRVGVTDFAQDELGDVVFVELPEPGDPLTAGESFGVIESIKAVSDLYAPADGEVVAVNDALVDRPELVNDDPYGEGWMLELRVDAEGDLLSAADYRGRVA
jgi:glycine cleavage system H protein